MLKVGGKDVLCLLLLLSTCAACTAQVDKIARDPACHTLTPASAGGPLPRDPDLMVLRYLGTSNYEVAFRGKVLLLDAFFDGQRGPEARLIGLAASDITRADAIFVGHPHIDHIADAPAIAKRLRIPIFVAPAGGPVLEREQVPPNLVKYVSGGESIQMKGYTVMTALARHSSLDPNAARKYREAAAVVEPPSPGELTYLGKVLLTIPRRRIR